ncbi:MAG: hypothetical protein ACXW2X_10170 [Thermoanaerobaculia bacterium]
MQAVVVAVSTGVVWSVLFGSLLLDRFDERDRDMRIYGVRGLQLR